MYCTNCGRKMNDDDLFCSACGTAAEKKTRTCPNCGAELSADALICVNCGYETPSASAQAAPNVTVTPKSKLAAGLLAIFLGYFGVHNFYLGYTGKAVAQLLLGTLGGLCCGIGTLVSAVWGLVEGIMILTDNIKTDAKNQPLGE